MAIQDDNTILNKGDLKAYHEAIAPMLGGTFMVRTNNSDYYSTDEKVVGVWTDGKPIYQKTFNCGAGPNNTTKIINHNIENMDISINAFAICADSSGNMDIIPNANTTAFLSGMYVNRTSIGISSNWNMSARTCFATIQYTKTTDTAGSATTTPGAYDINFPNTWPANKEIYFGNGLYGQRFTGTYNGTAGTRTENVISSNLVNISFVSCGGVVAHWDGARVFRIPLLYSCETATENPNIVGSYILSNHTGLILRHWSGTTYSNLPYDIWVTYTK